MKRHSLLGRASWCVLIAGLSAGPVLAQQVTGQWDFKGGDLSATVGADGIYWLRPETSGRDVAAETQFGTTTSFGIPNINGQPANVMRFPNNDRKMGYAMYPEIEANGGGNYVNQYTIIMDILFPAASSGWRGLVQTNSCNTNDGDMFVNPGSGIGISGQYAGTILPDTWHRVAFSVDLTSGPALGKYIDGVQVAVQIVGAGVDGRWSLNTKASNDATLLFTDEDGETAAGYVNSIQVRNYAMTDAELAALGTPTADGIPSGPGVTGQWDFENGDLTSTVGRSLVYFRGCDTGPCPQALAGETQFGLGSQFGLPPINEVDPTVMRFPAVVPCTGYWFPHGAQANGESAQHKVNQYSLIMDVYFTPEDYAAGGWISLLQTDPMNSVDAQLQIRTSDGAIGDEGQYAGTEGSVMPGNWYRIVMVIDTTTDRFSKYVNGQFLAQQSSGAGDGVHSLFTQASAAGGDYMLLFTDEDQETTVGYVSSIQVRDYAMTNDEVLALGGPTAAGIGFEDPPLARKAPDTNNDGFVNEHDLAEFVACAGGPAVPIPENQLLLCRNFDVDDDNDVDQADFGAFQQFYSGTTSCGANCYYP